MRTIMRDYSKRSWQRAAVLVLLLAATAASAQVSYIERSWNGSAVTEVENVRQESEYTRLTANGGGTLNLEAGGWYVVSNSDVKYKTLVAPAGTAANIILCDNSKLTAQITIEQGHALNIYAQSGGHRSVRSLLRERR